MRFRYHDIFPLIFMHLSDFQFELPPELIAQSPLPVRDASKLMRLDAKQRKIAHHSFRDITQFLKEGDLLVLNDTRVIPARLIGRKSSGGKIEVLLLKTLQENDWEALVHPSYKWKQGVNLSVGDHGFRMEALDAHTPGKGFRTVRLHPNGSGSAREALREFGHVPLPPYIKRPDGASDRERYQTVFAKNEGAVAAPTAGLHFTDELLATLRRQGVETAFVTLHVGYGTFKPVTAEKLEDHNMHEESFSISAEAADRINRRRGRLIACGTTSLRALESAADPNGKVRAGESRTKIFIYPPYEFKTADALVTNFHLPASTLIMLVSAFGGYELIREAYEEAKKHAYRFYSYGDAMLIERR